MTPAATLVAIVLAPVLILMVLRVNAALVFLSLCLGDVLVQFVASDTNSVLNFIASSDAQKFGSGSMPAKIILLLFPVVLTTIFMVRTVRGKAKLLLNVLPSAGVGLLGALLLVPLLPPGLRHNIVASSLWDQAQRAQDLIVGASALVCLFAIWLQRSKVSFGKQTKH